MSGDARAVCLLDVNVLIALIDPRHVQHDAAHDWFERRGSQPWATCPLTENGVLRIVGHPRYPNSPGTPAAVTKSLAGLCALPGHVFWSDDLILLRCGRVDASRLLTSAQITDSYLLALACERGGTLATFDRRLVTSAVDGGADALELI
ncbi:MAG: TA system VapC family ribonuclease toxin [Burkholderiales bacterium]